MEEGTFCAHGGGNFLQPPFLSRSALPHPSLSCLRKSHLTWARGAGQDSGLAPAAAAVAVLS